MQNVIVIRPDLSAYLRLPRRWWCGCCPRFLLALLAETWARVGVGIGGRRGGDTSRLGLHDRWARLIGRKTVLGVDWDGDPETAQEVCWGKSSPTGCERGGMCHKSIFRLGTQSTSPCRAGPE